jgi:hypothetical protein
VCYWDCEFESRRGHGCLSVVSVVCCQVDVSATSWSLVQRSPTDCGVSKSVIVKLRKMRRPRPPRGCVSLCPYSLITQFTAGDLHFYE